MPSHPGPSYQLEIRKFISHQWSMHTHISQWPALTAPGAALAMPATAKRRAGVAGVNPPRSLSA